MTTVLENTNIFWNHNFYIFIELKLFNNDKKLYIILYNFSMLKYLICELYITLVYIIKIILLFFKIYNFIKRFYI